MIWLSDLSFVSLASVLAANGNKAVYVFKKNVKMATVI